MCKCFYRIQMKNLFKYRFLLFLLLSIAVFAHATIPFGYYKNAEGKKDAELKTALFMIIRPHTQLEYYASSTYFRTTDWHPSGYFWDMYSSIQRTSWTGMNREHNLPKSWWSDAPETTVAYTDLHNLYPSDAAANTEKSNYPPGEVGVSSFDNGVFKVGSNTFSGYSGLVFEPSNQYKGDFARDYMYMVTCYEDYSANWRSLGTSSMLQRNTYPVLNTYAVNLLLKWHRNDPVSEKEINRNDDVYGFQNNRNPFIDHPELAEYIWGKYKGNAWIEGADEPETDNNFKAWYNLAQKTIKVNLKKPENAVFSIVSLEGTEITKGKFDISGSAEIDIQRGIYIVVVYTKTTRKTQKLLII